jgi:TetR/AcrR family transcriptional regulator, ethionamide resistance regulator
VSTPAQRARRRAKRESTRGEILAAADRLLREQPYRELSVDVVMASTSLTRTAFYRHFDDVTDLVLQLLADVGHELFALAERWSEAAGTADLTAARGGLAGIVDFFVRHGPLVRAFAEAGAADEQIEQAYRGALDTFTEFTRQTLDRLAQDGWLQVPDTGALARALNLMNEAYLLHEFGREPFGDREVALETLQTVWLRVVGPTGAGTP